MDNLNIFLSHSSKDAKMVADVAKFLDDMRMNTFVANTDIEPTINWQNELEIWLRKMDVMAAFITENYCTSIWCNQEAGYALGKGCLIIPLRFSVDPKGFIGKLQALSAPIDLHSLATKIRNFLFSYGANPENTLIRRWALATFINSRSWKESNSLAPFIAEYSLDSEELLKLRAAYRNNIEISEAHKVRECLSHLDIF